MQLNGCIEESRSLETIYESAVPKCNSSSSEEDLGLNSSDDQLNVKHINNKGIPLVKQIDSLIAEVRRVSTDRDGEGRENTPLSNHDNDVGEPQQTPEDRVRDMIQQAESAKARMFANAGNKSSQLSNQMLTPSALVDEGYIVVGAHLEEQLVNKIKVGDYVDFGKLIPRDRNLDEEGRMEMFVKNGKTFWMPASTSINISNFSKWEQAFQVFSNIYSKANPHRAAKLIEYNHVIHTISLSYIWENVHSYDKDFHRHMANFRHCSWAIILQQAWSLCLRDRIAPTYNQHFGHTAGNSVNGHAHGKPKINEPCHRFNLGKCDYGANCKFEHQCSYCFKFGHGVLSCRKAQADRGVTSHSKEKDTFKKEPIITQTSSA